MNRLFTLLPLTLILVALFSGCSSSGPKQDPAYAPMRPVAPEPVPTGNGSIYQAGHEMVLFENIGVRRVGDLLTVNLVENTQANKSASTATKESAEMSMSNPTLFGSTPQFDVPDTIPLASNEDNTLEFGFSSSSDFSGDGTSSLSNALTGSITVSVVEVLPNRNLYVRGEKSIGINQGYEYVRLSGIVRPQDITPQNTVESTRIGDPKISYVGDGTLADANSEGWLSRFFSSVLSPF
jgi:flagellar L-ring protein precursor FlgH